MSAYLKLHVIIHVNTAAVCYLVHGGW